MEDLFRRYYRNLPHWRARGYPYFVTWRLHSQHHPLTGEERTLVVDSLRFFEGSRYTLHAYVVMDDHVHVIILPEDDVPSESILHSWKSYTSHELVKRHNRVSPVWQDESFDRVLRTEMEFHEKARYILNNPLDRWPDEIQYAWVWVRGMEEKG